RPIAARVVGVSFTGFRRSLAASHSNKLSPLRRISEKILRRIIFRRAQSTRPKLWNGTDGSSPLQHTGTIDVCGRSFVKTSFVLLSPGSRNIRNISPKYYFEGRRKLFWGRGSPPGNLTRKATWGRE